MPILSVKDQDSPDSIDGWGGQDHNTWVVEGGIAACGSCGTLAVQEEIDVNWSWPVLVCH